MINYLGLCVELDTYSTHDTLFLHSWSFSWFLIGCLWTRRLGWGDRWILVGIRGGIIIPWLLIVTIASGTLKAVLAKVTLITSIALVVAGCSRLLSTWSTLERDGVVAVRRPERSWGCWVRRECWFRFLDKLGHKFADQRQCNSAIRNKIPDSFLSIRKNQTYRMFDVGIWPAILFEFIEGISRRKLPELKVPLNFVQNVSLCERLQASECLFNKQLYTWISFRRASIMYLSERQAKSFMFSESIANLSRINNVSKGRLVGPPPVGYPVSLFNHAAKAWMLFIESYIGIYMSNIRLLTVCTTLSSEIRILSIPLIGSKTSEHLRKAALT